MQGQQGGRSDEPGSVRQPEGPSNLRSLFREGFTLMVGAASWAFEQGDRLIDTWMEQGQLSREESRRKFEEFTERTRRSGQEFGRRVSESVRRAGSSMPASRVEIENLERRIAELQRELDAMKASQAGQGPARPPSQPRSTERPV
jgi:polyhydroxyalkanoate synthesis regulator phasin